MTTSEQKRVNSWAAAMAKDEAGRIQWTIYTMATTLRNLSRELSRETDPAAVTLLRQRREGLKKIMVQYVETRDRARRVRDLASAK